MDIASLIVTDYDCIRINACCSRIILVPYLRNPVIKNKKLRNVF